MTPRKTLPEIEDEWNIINSSRSEPLKLYTIYSPPEHPDGTVHETKADADAYEREHHR